MSTNKLSIVVRGQELEIADLGGIGEPLVFLHEGLGSLGRWRDFPDLVGRAAGYRPIVYSRRGNGYSSVLEGPRDPQYMHDEADVLVDVLDALGLERVALYGHSDGASIALIAAARYPDRVASIVVEAPHVFVEQTTLRAIAEIGARYRADSVFRNRFARHHRSGDATFFGWSDIWLDERFAAWTIVEMLPLIAAPILCIQGTADAYGTLAQIDAIADSSGASVDRIALAGTGHAPHEERQNEVVAFTSAWLRAR